MSFLIPAAIGFFASSFFGRGGRNRGSSYDNSAYQSLMQQQISLNAEIKNMNQHNNKLKQELSALDQNNGALKGQINGLKGQITQNEQECSAMRERANGMSRTIDTLNQSVKQYQQRIQIIEKQNFQFQQEVKKLQLQLEEDNDVDKFMNNRDKSFERYLQNIKVKFNERMPEEHRASGQGHIAMLGQTSAGKSSLLNKLYGLSLDVGVGVTTQRSADVLRSRDGRIVLWDCPGVDGRGLQMSIYTPKTLIFFMDASLVLLVYTTSVSTIKDLCLAMFKFKPNHTILVRNKCDTYREGLDNKTIEQENEADMAQLRQWGMNFRYPIFSVSAHKDLDFRDNRKLKELLDDASRYI